MSTTTAPKALRLQHPKPEPPIEIAHGVRPGVSRADWFGETRYLECASHFTDYGSTLIPSLGKCACGVAWKVGDEQTIWPKEPCATCVRKAQREHEPQPESVELWKLYICTFCGEAMCKAHVWFYGYGEDTEYTCRNCARERKLPANREFDYKEW